MANSIYNLINGISTSVDISQVEFKSIKDLSALHSCTNLYNYEDIILNYQPNKNLRGTLRKFDTPATAVLDASGAIDPKKIMSIVSAKNCIVLENKVAIIYIRFKSRVGRFAVLDISKLNSSSTKQIKDA